VPNLWQTLRGRASSSDEKRYTFSEWMNDQLMFQGGSYPLVGASTYGTKAEVAENSFAGYTQAAYKHNGIVFAIVLSRMLLFTEARFQWQRLSNGRPTDLFGSQDLAVLETPWPNGTTGELLARMEQDVSLAGNFFAVREADRIRRLRPDWVQIVLSAPPEVSARSDVVGYRYVPGGVASGEGEIFLPEQVCHWSPIPDPIAQYRGMSWITPVMREIQADGAATEHKAHFFDNAATPNLAVSMKDPMTPAQFREFVDAMDDAHRGAHNAYKTLYTGGGADVSVIGADMRQLDFRQTQGAGETRVCAAGGVPPIIVGLSEGLKAGTYSNYGMARRKFGDHWARPQWRARVRPCRRW
jgi:phage portal protein BeeE